MITCPTCGWSFQDGLLQCPRDGTPFVRQPAPAVVAIERWMPTIEGLLAWGDYYSQNPGTCTAYAPVELDMQCNAALEAVGDAAVATCELLRCVCNVYLISKEIDARTRQYVASMQASAQRTQAVAPVMMPAVQSLSAQAAMLVQRATAIDSLRCTPVELQLRMRLLQMAYACNQQIMQLMMRLMAL